MRETKEGNVKPLQIELNNINIDGLVPEGFINNFQKEKKDIIKNEEERIARVKEYNPDEEIDYRKRMELAIREWVDNKFKSIYYKRYKDLISKYRPDFEPYSFNKFIRSGALGRFKFIDKLGIKPGLYVLKSLPEENSYRKYRIDGITPNCYLRLEGKRGHYFPSGDLKIVEEEDLTNFNIKEVGEDDKNLKDSKKKEEIPKIRRMTGDEHKDVQANSGEDVEEDVLEPVEKMKQVVKKIKTREQERIKKERSEFNKEAVEVYQMARRTSKHDFIKWFIDNYIK
ncbi:MAG: hypothetical protein GF349_01830 [Candidatus Magasanikbacteria bacterium]|nr:hypothetical protein [Candidatus Magasanikbacteria bacterium]